MLRRPEAWITFAAVVRPLAIKVIKPKVSLPAAVPAHSISTAFIVDSTSRAHRIWSTLRLLEAKHTADGNNNTTSSNSVLLPGEGSPLLRSGLQEYCNTSFAGLYCNHSR